jgi:tetratricopeptide (TPR) repeat protein
MTVSAFSAVASPEFLNYDDTIHALAAITRHQVSCWHDSRSLFERALKLDSENHMALNNLAVLLAAEGRSEKAIGYYRRSLPLVPNQPYVHVNLGNRYFHLRRFAEAEKYYRQALRLDPDFAAGYFRMANLRILQGRNAEAAQFYRKVIALEPNHGEALLQLRRLEGGAAGR